MADEEALAKEEREIQGGRDAQTLLDNPILTEVLRKIEEAFSAQLRNSFNADEIWDAKYMLVAMDNFCTQLTSIVQTGNLAEVGKLQRISELRESDERFNG